LTCLVDTSCLVALSWSEHQHHERTIAELDARRKKRETLAVAAHSLAEAYSVLTRLPPPSRIEPSLAAAGLRAVWRGEQAVALTAEEVWAVIEKLPERGISGGRTYDALIAACAKKARVDTLLTWNSRHFIALADGFDVVEPA
jgi:predicted nucleic acid-binding protein